MRPRSYILATLASLGVVGVGIGAGVEGQAIAHSASATNTTTTTSGTTTATQGASGTTAQASGADSSSTTGSSTDSTVTTSTTPSASASASASTGSGLKDGTYTGAAASTRYGDVQVKITVAGGKITAAEATEYPTDNPRDQEVNQQAVPILNGEVTQAQSASISQVSGATYTSGGYITSLQAALEQAQA